MGINVIDTATAKRQTTHNGLMCLLDQGVQHESIYLKIS